MNKINRKVLITGGGGDIAQAIKNQLEAMSFDVYAPSRFEMDVTNWDNIDYVMKGYRPDILINNAGYVVPHSVRNEDLENTKRHIEVNIGGMFYCTEIALKYNPKLDIINIGSAAAVEVHATWSEYCASKAAMVMATKCWAQDGLYAVVLSPGRTRTKMRKSLYPNEDPSTLLNPIDFAKVVIKAINKDYKSGVHIIVKKDNIQSILEIDRNLYKG